MTTVTVTVGWTRSDMANGYSSFSDGYRPGASQHTEVLTFDVPEGYDDSLICEAVFTATNAPGLIPRDGLPYVIEQAVRATGYDGRGAHYSLSVGDTVTINEQVYACENSGWRIVR